MIGLVSGFKSVTRRAGAGKLPSLILDSGATAKSGESYAAIKARRMKLNSAAAKAKVMSNIKKYLNNRMGYVNSGDFIEDVGKAAGAIIIQRTISGMDYLGKPFKKYSAKYLKYKQKQGKYRGKVDLWSGGSMLNSLQFVATTPNMGYISIGSGQHPNAKISLSQMGDVHHGGLGVNPARKFLGWSKNSVYDMKLRILANNLIMENMRKEIGGTTARFSPKRIPIKPILR